MARSALRNSAYSILAFAWPLALAFFATPFIVGKLGAFQYGIFAMIMSFIGFFAVLDFGVAPSLVKYTAELHAKNSYKELGLIFSSALLFYMAVGAIGAILIIVLVPIFMRESLMSAPDMTHTVRVLSLLAAIGFLVNMVVSAFSALPSALQRFDITGRINISLATLSTLATLGLVAAGFGLVGITSVGVLTSLLAVVIYRIINKNILPQVRFTARLDRRATKKIFGFSAFAFLATISGVIIAQLDRLILGWLQGPIEVTYYVIPGNLAIKIHGLAVAATAVIFPLAAELIAKKDYDSLQSTYKKATRLLTSILIMGITPMMVLSDTFLHYWIGPDIARNSALILQVLLATYFFSALHVIPYQSAFGAGKPKYSAFYALAVAVMNISFMFLLIPSMGAKGAAWAYLIAVVPTTLFFVRYIEYKVIKISSGMFYLRLYTKIAPIFLLELALALLIKPYINSIVLLGVGYVLLLGIAAFLYVAFLMEQEDRDIIKRAAHKIGLGK